MGKNNDALMIAAIVGGALFLPSILGKGEDGGMSFTFGGFGGGDTPALDLSGILGGLPSGTNFFGDFSAGLNDLFSGVGGAFSSLGNAAENLNSGGNNTGLDINGLLDKLLGAIPNVPNTGTGGGGGLIPQIPSAQTIGQNIGDIGGGLQEVAKAAIMGGGAYLGFKALQPVAPVVGRAVAGGVKAVASPATKVVGSVASNAAKFLTSPVSKAFGSVGGALGSTVAVIGAGAAGYAAGSWFNTTSAGQALIEKSGELGAKVAAGNNPIQAVLFPHANVSSAISTDTRSNFEKKWGITLDQAQSMTTAQLQEIMQNVR